MMDMSLSGKTIVITRAANQAKPFAEMLGSLGAKIVLFPTIKISPPEDSDYIRKTLANLGAFQWIIFTSANAVRYFFNYMNKKNNTLQKVKIASVGKKTTEVLKTFHLSPTIIPKTYTSNGLLNAIVKHDIRGKRILLPVSNLAGNELQEGLQAHGALVERLEIYKNIPDTDSKKELLLEKLEKHQIDCITFFSPSAINTFTELVGDKGITLINKKKITIAVIGSTTLLAAQEKNLQPTIQPSQSDERSFVEEIKKYFGMRD
jgi:uroporphyrinogen III methyltransferase/synthase